MSQPTDHAVLPVYVIHWNAPEWCAATVLSFLSSDGVRIAVTVVDNGGPRGAALKGLLSPQVQLLEPETNLGFAGAGNVAIAHWMSASEAPFCVIASHDVRLESDTLALLVRTAKERPQFGVLAPAHDGPPGLMSGGRWNGWRAVRSTVQAEETPVVEHQWVAGRCMLLRRDCIRNEAVGGFDERLGSYHEDVDLCLRVRAAGFAVGYVPEARISSSGSVSESVSYWTDRNSVLLAAKHGGPQALMLALVMLVGRCARTILASLAPWRSKARRRASRSSLAMHLRALRDCARAPGLLRSLLSEHSAARNAGPESPHRHEA